MMVVRARSGNHETVSCALSSNEEGLKNHKVGKKYNGEEEREKRKMEKEKKKKGRLKCVHHVTIRERKV